MIKAKTLQEIQIENHYKAIKSMRVQVYDEAMRFSKEQKYVRLEDYYKDIAKVKQEAFMVGRIYASTGEKENPAEIQEVLDRKCAHILYDADEEEE